MNEIHSLLMVNVENEQKVEEAENEMQNDEETKTQETIVRKKINK